MCDLLVSLPRLWREPPARERFVVTDATLDSSSVVCTVGQRVAMFASKWPVVVIHMPLAEAGAGDQCYDQCVTSLPGRSPREIQ